MDGQDLLKIIEVITHIVNIFKRILNILWKCGKSIFNVIKITFICSIIVAFIWLVYTHKNFFTNLSYFGAIGMILWFCPLLLNMCWTIADPRDFFRFFKKEKGTDLETFGYSAAGWGILIGSFSFFYKISYCSEFLSFIQTDFSSGGFFSLLCFLFITIYFCFLFLLQDVREKKYRAVVVTGS